MFSHSHVGFEIDSTVYEIAMQRVLSLVGIMLKNSWTYLPADGVDNITKERSQIPHTLTPPWITNLNSYPDDISAAICDAKMYNMDIKKSTVLSAGNGLFAQFALKAGRIIGYYWGNVHVSSPRLDQVLQSDRILQLYKYVIEDGQKKYLNIVASKRCSAGYINDPRTISQEPNAAFEESANIIFGYQLVTVRLLTDVQKGDEIFADYGQAYIIESATSSHQPQTLIPLSPMDKDVSPINVTLGSLQIRVTESSAGVNPSLSNIPSSADSSIPFNLNTCSGCGDDLKESGHRCDICQRANHPFCGLTLGEGYGSAVRCKSHGETESGN